MISNKYGKIIGQRVAEKADQTPMFGFATPKKDNMLERTNLVLSATKKTPLSKALERVTPRKSPYRSANATPTKEATPLSRLKLRGDGPNTPRHVRKKVTAEIEKRNESSSSNEDSEDSDEDDIAVHATSEKDTDDFFERQSSKQIVTSDTTLNQARGPCPA